MLLKRLSLLITCVAVFCLIATTCIAQESTVKGNLAGVVTDASGAVVPAAKLTVTGPNGSETATSDANGKFLFSALTPGFYKAKVAKDTFKTVNLKSVEVLTGRTAQLNVKLEPGASEITIEVTADASTVDTTSTAVGANLTDQFYNSVPVQRNVASLFYTAPGVVDGGGTGNANPSISGGSGLENLYIADGVNITNSAYGGLGVYTQNQGAIGSGINLSFIKEVDVKTGGFEPQYGQATGGIVQIITKSGSSTYHGALAGYFAPSGTRATELFRDDVRVRLVGERISRSEYEASAELGGYIPGAQNHLFFFGSFDPTRITNVQEPPATSGLFKTFGTLPQHFNTFNYAGKLTYRLNDKHSIEGSVFGDPARTNTSELTNSLNSSNNTNFSSWRYGTRNIVGRYNGTLSPTWLVNASYSNNTNYFFEKPLSDVFQIVDISGPQSVTLQGFGLLEEHDAHQWGLTADTSKVVHLVGTHTFSVGYHQERPEYTNIQNRSGGTYGIPGKNYLGGSYLPAGSPIPLAGAQTDAQFNIIAVPAGAACPICPVFNGQQVYANQTRGQFGGSGSVPTHAIYQDAYFNDSWSLNKYVTASLGIRWEQQQVFGTLTKYTFTDNWSPRIGVSVDPTGNRKTKIYANFGRYSYDLPLDAAIRSLSGENDLLGEIFAPVVSGGKISIVPDSAHTLNGTDPAFPAPALSIASLSENFVHGTKMSYENEFVVGAEHEWKGIVFSARYLDRRLQRIIEDASGTSPEGAFVHLQNFSIVNPSPTLDAFVNEQEKVVPFGTPIAAFPAGCDASNTLGVVFTAGGVPIGAGTSSDSNGNQFSPNSVCFPSPGPGLVGGDYGADGKPDGFVSPIRNYTAWEFEVNKSFSQHYLMRINYRHAKLFGNYEGAFRNDNGQSDPGISSLFDFTAGQYNLLGNQFTPGYLPTDRRNVINTFFSYTADRSALRGLTIGTSVRVQSGTPVSQFADHPVYQNSGEVPIGGRGSQGRTPVSGNVDLKLNYPVKLGERFTFRMGADIFNIANARPALTLDQARDRSGLAANSNKDFLTATSYQAPFSARFSVKLEF